MKLDSHTRRCHSPFTKTARCLQGLQGTDQKVNYTLRSRSLAATHPPRSNGYHKHNYRPLLHASAHKIMLQANNHRQSQRKGKVPTALWWLFFIVYFFWEGGGGGGGFHPSGVQTTIGFGSETHIVKTKQRNETNMRLIIIFFHPRSSDSVGQFVQRGAKNIRRFLLEERSCEKWECLSGRRTNW